MRFTLIIGLVALVVVGLGGPASAQDSTSSDAFVVLNGPADVPVGRQVGDLVVFHGSSNVAGTVDGSLTAFDAPVVVSGRVNGDLVVFNGRVALGPGARVTGDVVSQDDPVVAPGAVIGGSTKRVETNVNLAGFGWLVALIWWLGTSVATLVLGLLLVWLSGRGARRIIDAARTATGPAIGWGALLFFALPVLAVLALVTIIGLPIGLGLLASLGLIYSLGYAASAWVLGRRIFKEPASWVLAYLTGWGILRVLALVPVLGSVVWFAAVVFGLGSLLVAVWQARTTPTPTPTPAPAPQAAPGPA
ncbi:MAG: hypothetical protein ACXVW8_13740 [Nocardioidaceae bacterium]